MALDSRLRLPGDTDAVRRFGSRSGGWTLRLTPGLRRSRCPKGSAAARSQGRRDAKRAKNRERAALRASASRRAQRGDLVGDADRSRRAELLVDGERLGAEACLEVQLANVSGRMEGAACTGSGSGSVRAPARGCYRGIGAPTMSTSTIENPIRRTRSPARPRRVSRLVAGCADASRSRRPRPRSLRAVALRDRRATRRFEQVKPSRPRMSKSNSCRRATGAAGGAPAHRIAARRKHELLVRERSRRARMALADGVVPVGGSRSPESGEWRDRSAVDAGLVLECP